MSSWPGERENPTRQDVEVANELPASSFLSDFKTALAASPEAADLQTLMLTDLNNAADVQSQCSAHAQHTLFTYPLAMLSDFPATIPTPAELDNFQESFAKFCGTHVFLGRLPIPQPSISRESIVPPLRLATACLASIYAGNTPSEARDLFFAGAKLWAVMMEVDNRESRSLDSLVASLLLASYGALSSDGKVRGMTAIIISSSITITRRLRLHDSAQLGYLLGQRAFSHSAAFVWFLWLVDILYGLHSDLSLSSISTREIWTKMPSNSSGSNFQETYHAFLEDKDLRTGTRDIKTTFSSLSQDDAILILMAFLSDSLYIRRSIGQQVHVTDLTRNKKTGRNFHSHNPFVPLAPHTETDRMQNIISSALDRWYATFNTNTVPSSSSPPGMMAFYYYCRLYISCPQILFLPRMVGYKSLHTPGNPSLDPSAFTISDQSVQHAWRILNDAAARSKSDILCPLWLPIFVFHASLVVWAKQQQQLGGTQHQNGYGSSRILLAFKVELEGMPWPCCREMSETLEQLMVD